MLKVAKNYVLVKVMEPERTLGFHGILLKADQSLEHNRAKVISVCSNWDDLECVKLKRGDIIIFNSKADSTNDIRRKNGWYKILNYKEIFVKDDNSY